MLLHPATYSYVKSGLMSSPQRPVISKMMGDTKEETTKHYYSVDIPEIIEGRKMMDFAATHRAIEKMVYFFC
jgi:hypothetical protein